jgi:hypothetical protein
MVGCKRGRRWERERERGGGYKRVGAARVREERGLQTRGCEINDPQPKLSSELPAPANECQNSTVPLRYAPPKSPNSNGTKHERGGKEI